MNVLECRCGVPWGRHFTLVRFGQMDYRLSDALFFFHIPDTIARQRIDVDQALADSPYTFPVGSVLQISFRE